MIHSPEILKMLETAPLFRGIPNKLVAKNLSQSKLRTLNSGEILLVTGQANNLIYIILSGRLSIQSKESDVEPIAMLSEGECVGEMSILGDGRVSAYVIAATDCKLLAIDHNALWDMIDRSHVAAHNMLSILSKRIRMTDQVMAESLEHHHGFSGVSVVDELTGLCNRHWMYEKFERCLQRSIMNNKPSCLVMLEMDQFKAFSDSYGQLGSDQALRNIAHTMMSCLRPNDQAGHYLGEQFAIFLPDTSLFDACIASERLRETINQSMVVLPSGDALPSISISLGISQVNPNDTLVNLFARADESLQRAKEGGGNCIKCVK
ncbi:MAG: GGDEF domain-containing protein [Gallionella sp.]|nr:GGDEF domain-containing protein [Gallionella sp.]